MTTTPAAARLSSAAEPTRRAKYAFLVTLYSTQYLAVSFFFIAFPAIMRNEGVSLQQLGAFQLIGLIWVVKLVWAPLVDQRTLGRLGHHRGWLLVCQIGMIVGNLALVAYPPPEQLGPIVLLMAIVVTFAATQDIAADAVGVRLLRPEERGMGNAMQSAGGLVGGLIGGGVVLAVYSVTGWTGAMLTLAVGTALPLTVIWTRSDLSDPVMPSAVTDSAHTPRWGDVLRLFRRPGMASWLLTGGLFFMGASLGYALLSPLLVDAGWSLDRIALVLTGVGSVAGIAGALLAGRLIDRLGRRRTLLTVAMAQAVGVGLLGLIAAGQTGTVTVATLVAVLSIPYGANATVIACLIMDRCDPVSAGTDYTVQYSALTLGAFLISSGGLAMAGVTGYGGAIILGVAVSVLAIVNAWRRTDLDAAAGPPVVVERGVYGDLEPSKRSQVS